MAIDRPCMAGCNNPACCPVRCLGPLQDQKEGGLYGEHGALRRFAAAANGIHEIADKLREQSTQNRARLVREALMEARKAAVARPGGVRGDIWRAFNDLCEADDETLSHLGRLLK